MDKINWKKTKVLVTGADGFIGSHVAKELADRGSVTAIVRDIKTEHIDVLGLKMSNITMETVNFEDWAVL